MIPRTKWSSGRTRAEGTWVPSNVLVTFTGHSLLIRQPYRAPDQPEHLAIDLDKFWLPTTPFTGRPICLLERPDLVRALAACIEIYARRTAVTKSAPRRLSAAVFSITKFFEYGWLNGAYAMADWTPELCSQLFEELKVGGWPGALRIVDRAASLLKDGHIDPATHLSLKEPKKGASLVDSTREVLGTNLFHCALRDVRLMMVANSTRPADVRKIKSLVRRSPPTAEAGMSAGLLISETAFVNLLGEVAEPVGMSFTPFPMSRMRAVKEARGAGRTPTFRPEEVAALLVDAHRWIEEIAPPLLVLLSEIARGIERAGFVTSGAIRAHIHEIVAQSSSARAIEHALRAKLAGMNNTRKFGDRVAVGRLVERVQTACFTTIGILNARRRDEIQHGVIGLQRASLRAVDERLDLFECDFYIEKTFKTRVPFFVGSFTARAFNVLREIGDSARRLRVIDSGTVVERDGDAPLFEVPRFGVVGPRRLSLYSFEAARANQFRNPHPLLPAGPKLIRSHMFRRAHALTYHYRFELGDLLGLADRLGHVDLESVRVYVTNGPITTDGSADIEAYARLRPDQRAAVKQEVDDILSTVHQVGQERVLGFVESVMSGRERHSGGFATLVKRLHQKLGNRLEYSLATPAEQQKGLGNFLVKRGHVFRPFAHGNCVAAENRLNRGAGCYSKEAGAIDRSRAAPAVCATCPYHVVAVGHMQSLARELKRIKGEREVAGDDTVHSRQLAIEEENLRRAIALHEKRLGLKE